MRESSVASNETVSALRSRPEGIHADLHERMALVGQQDCRRPRTIIRMRTRQFDEQGQVE